MFRDYFYEIDQTSDTRDQYIIKHIYHIVTEFCFDFELVTESLNNLLYNLGEKQVQQQDCEQYWTQYHISRYYNKHTLYRTDQQFKQQKKVVRFQEEEPKKCFNVLKDSVRIGGTDKEKREREKSLLEQKLFENIDKIKEVSDVDSYKPLKYIVKFDEEGNITLENQELIDEDVEKLKVNNIVDQKLASNSSDSSDDDEDYLELQRSLIKKQ